MISRQLFRASVSGVVGTAAFDIQGLFLTGKFWDVPSLVAASLQAPFATGLALHYTLGVTLAILYVGLLPMIPGPRWAKPFVFMTVQTFVFMTLQTVVGISLFMVPLMGAGAVFPLISMIQHWAYAAAVGGMTGAFQRSKVTITAAQPLVG